MNNAPVTMSIITEGAGTHFLMFLQHMIMSEQEYKLGQTPIHSTKQDFKNRWDTWTHGLEFNTPGPAKKNITLGGTSWNDQYNIETTYNSKGWSNTLWCYTFLSYMVRGPFQ